MTDSERPDSELSGEGDAAPRNQPGQRLAGRYALTRRIAAGGMGQVWEATDELLGRQVAVKIPFPALAADPEFRLRFAAEARLTAQLAHPNVTQVYDVGEHDNTPYLVMELIAGVPLSELLVEGTLDEARTLDIVAQTAAALDSAHASGIIHRDIKPANLLVTGQWGQGMQVKVTDLGIARAADAVPLTRTGTVIGSAAYVAPERLLGGPAGPATDIYALGVVAYECLAGTRPFGHGASPALLDGPIAELPDHLHDDVRRLVLDCIARDPAARPHSARQLAHRAQALRAQLGGSPPAPVGATQVLPPPESRTAVLTSVAPVQHAPRRADPPVTALRSFAPDPLRERGPSATAVVAGLLVLALIAVLTYVVVLSRRGPDTPGSTVPPASASPSDASVVDARSLTGLRLVQARQLLKKAGFGVTTDPSVAGNADVVVTGVSPSGTQPRGTVITLHVAPRGPAPTGSAVPSVRPTPSAGRVRPTRTPTGTPRSTGTTSPAPSAPTTAAAAQTPDS